MPSSVELLERLAQLEALLAGQAELIASLRAENGRLEAENAELRRPRS